MPVSLARRIASVLLVISLVAFAQADISAAARGNPRRKTRAAIKGPPQPTGRATTPEVKRAPGLNPADIWMPQRPVRPSIEGMLAAKPVDLKALQNRYLKPWPKDRKIAFLTFDDGPDPEVTPLLLDMLKEKQVKATFFLIGFKAMRYPDLVKRTIAEGHAVGNHTWDHDTSQIYRTPEAFAESVEKASYAIWEAAGVWPTIVRPPNGSAAGMHAAHFWIMELLGYTVHDYNADYGEWRMPANASAEQFLESIKDYAKYRNYMNILSHDVKSHKEIVRATGIIIDYLRSKGYEFGVLGPDTPTTTHNRKTITEGK